MLDAKHQVAIKRCWGGRKGVEDGDVSSQRLRGTKLAPLLHRGEGTSRVSLAFGVGIRVFLHRLSKAGIAINS